MYKFHLDYAVKKWGDNIKLLFTDTDSLCYEIQTEDIYSDIRKDVPKWFDTSAYPEDHPAGLPRVNKKVIGLMKDEACGNQITEFIGLRSKLYSFNVENLKGENSETKKAKGVKKTTIKKDLTLDDYRNCLETKNEKEVTMRAIRSYKHTLYTEEIRKTALSSNDDKRVILSDGIHTRAFGHYLNKKCQ